MKLYISLVILALMMAFGTGYFALSIKGSYSATEAEIKEINEIKLVFQKTIDPLMIINFNSLYHNQSLFQLLDPVYVMGDENHRNLNYSRNDKCFKKLSSLLNRKNFEKVWIWEEFRCGKRSHLPASFFLSPPYVHPSGSSYAYLAFKSRNVEYSRRDWAISFLPYFHVLELKEVRNAIGSLGGIYNFLQTLSIHSLKGIVRGGGTILTNDFLMAKLHYPSVFSIVEYRVYSRDSLDYFLRNSPYLLQNYKIGKSCFFKDGPLCWDYNVRHLFRIANKGSLAVIFGFLIMIVLLVRLLIVKLKNQKFEDERRRLALQVLTHEFRTPIASMLLNIEQIQTRLTYLDDEFQESVLRLSDDIHRLRRLTETSRNYLRVDKSKKLVNIKNSEIPSLNNFISDQLFIYLNKYGEENMTCCLLEEDASFYLDPYWAGICIKNIINNAIDHGVFPITFSVALKKDHVIISIRDEGVLKIDNPEDIWDEFIKGSQSKGTGLGLNIVKKVIKEMGGQIDLSTHPTIFKLTFKRGKKEQEDG